MKKTTSEIAENAQKNESTGFDAAEDYRRILDNSLDIICQIDAGGNFVTVSAAARKVWGYEPEELIGTSYWHLVHPDDNLKTTQATNNTMAGKPTHTFENRTMRKDGSVAYMMWSGNWSEKYQIMYCVARDVSELRLAETAPEESETNYRSLIESLPAIVYLSQPIQPYASIYISPGAEAFGYSVDEWKGRPDMWISLIHDEDRERVLVEAAQAIASETETELEYRMVTHSGKIHWMRDKGQLISDTDGNVTGWQRVITDVTKRTLAEAKSRQDQLEIQARLRASEERFRVIYEAEPECVKLVGRECEVLDMNPAGLAMIGADSLEQVRGTTFLDLLMPEYRNAFAELNRKVFAGENGTLEFEIIGLKGSRRWLDTHATPLLNDRGEVEAHLAVTRDTTEHKRADAELRRSREHMARAQRVARLGSWETDLSTMAVRWSEETYRIFEVDPASFQPTHEGFLQHVHPDDRAAVDKEFADSLAQHSDCSIKHRLLMPDGRIKVIKVRWEILRDADEVPVTAVGTCQDLTSRTLAEASQRDAEERLRLLFDQMKDGFYYSTPDGQLLDINPAMVEMFGYSSREEMLKVDVARDLYFLPEDRKSRTLGDGWETSKAYRMRRKDGSPIWVEDRGQYKYNEEGNVAFHQGLLRDVTERRLTEATLIQSAQRYRDLIENAYDMIYTRDMDGNITSINAAGEKLTGYSREEFLQMNMREIVVPEHLDRAEEISAQKLAGNEESSYEMDILAKGGRRITLEVNTTLMSRAGVAVGVQGIARDITERKLAEESLKQSELRYRDLVENANEIIYSLDLEGNFTSLNRSGERIVGYTLEEVVKMNFSEVVAPEHLEHAKKMMEEKLRGGEGTSLEIDIIAKDGRQISLEITSKLAVHGGVPVGIQGIARDVTERKAARVQLEQSSALLRIAGQAAQLGGWRLELPERTLTWSDENCSIYDVLPGYIPTFEEGIACYHPENRAEVLAYINNCAENGTPYDFELPIVTAKGRPIWIRSMGEAVRDTDGTIIRLHGAIQDITDRKSAEESLRQTNSLIRIAGELTLTGGWAIELAENQVFWTDEIFDILEFPRGKVPDLATRLELHPEPDRDRVTAGLDACAKDGTPLDIEVEIFTGTGRRIWVRLVAEADRKADGTIERIHGAFQDISDRKHAEEQLRQSQKLESVGLLAGGIAHDFNNMLTAINGYSDLTLRQMKADDPLRRNIQEVRKAGERSAALTNQLLAFSRRQILQPEVVYLNRIITETSTLLERMIGEDVALIVVLNPKTGQVKADPSQLTQIIMNLAVNARDAMPRGGKLTFETNNIFLDQEYTDQHSYVLPGAYVRLTVSDNGTGMDAETQQHIFEPFFTTKATGEGTGLGLAMVYGVVKQSNGHIMVDSEPGMGTTFTIYLPRVMEPLEEIESSTPDNELPRGSETILLVEDEEIVRKLTREILEICGYTVLEAANGKDALAICEKHAEGIDLLMTDVVMPEMSGRELAEKVSLRWPQMLVLFTSGYTDDAIVRHGVVNSASNFIQKPFTTEALARKVKDVFESDEEL